jgi:hypothetical protein
MLLWSMRPVLRTLRLSAALLWIVLESTTAAVLLPAVPNLLPATVRRVPRPSHWMRL